MLIASKRISDHHSLSFEDICIPKETVQLALHIEVDGTTCRDEDFMVIRNRGYPIHVTVLVSGSVILNFAQEVC